MPPYITDRFINFRVRDKCRTRIYINTVYTAAEQVDTMICLPRVRSGEVGGGDDTERHPELTTARSHSYRYIDTATDIKIRIRQAMQYKILSKNSN